MTSSPAARRRPRLVAAVAALTLAAAGCGVVEDASQAAGDAVDRVEFCVAALRVVQAVEARDLDGAVSAGEDLVDNAPDDVAADGQVVLDAARAARSGDTAALDAPDVLAAADRLQTRTREDCDPR